MRSRVGVYGRALGVRAVEVSGAAGAGAGVFFAKMAIRIAIRIARN